MVSEILQILRDILLPIAVMGGLGWGLDRRFSLSIETLVKLNIYLLVPAFIFVRVSEADAPGWLGLKIVLFTESMIVALGAISWALARWRGESSASRRSMQLVTMFYNCGNFGLPLTLLAFPETAPVVQIFVLMTMNVTTFSVGTMLAGAHPGPEGGAWWRTVLRQPAIHALVLAWLARALEIPVARATFLWTPLTYLADGLIGLALVTLGVQLSKARRPPLEGRLGAALAARLVGGPLVACGLVRLFGFEGDVARVLILGAGAPAAVATAMLAQEFGADPRFAAAGVFYSTVLSVVTIPILLVLLRLGT